MDRRTRNLFALVLVVVIAITGGAALLLSDTSILDPDGPSDTASVDGVIVAVDSAGLGDVPGFTMRRPGGETLEFRLGELENPTEFIPRHLGIDAQPPILPPRWHRASWALTQAATAGVSGLLAWYGWGMVGMEREVPAMFVPGVPSWWPMLAFPAGFALMAVRFAIAAFGPPPEHGAE